MRRSLPRAGGRAWRAGARSRSRSCTTTPSGRARISKFRADKSWKSESSSRFEFIAGPSRLPHSAGHATNCELRESRRAAKRGRETSLSASSYPKGPAVMTLNVSRPENLALLLRGKAADRSPAGTRGARKGEAAMTNDSKLDGRRMVQNCDRSSEFVVASLERVGDDVLRWT